MSALTTLEREALRLAALPRDRRAVEIAGALKRLQDQLPEEMRDCTIVLLRCEKGHCRLSATNWIDHGCYVCALEGRRS